MKLDYEKCILVQTTTDGDTYINVPRSVISQGFYILNVYYTDDNPDGTYILEVPSDDENDPDYAYVWVEKVRWNEPDFFQGCVDALPMERRMKYAAQDDIPGESIRELAEQLRAANAEGPDAVLKIIEKMEKMCEQPQA